MSELVVYCLESGLYIIIKQMSLVRYPKYYLQFLIIFRPSVQPVISIGLAVLIVYSIFKVLKKDWIFLIALIFLLPASQAHFGKYLGGGCGVY